MTKRAVLYARVSTQDQYDNGFSLPSQLAECRTRPKGEQIPIPVPPIIDRATWEAARERRMRSKRIAEQKSRRKYLLTGLIRCECGLAMSGCVSNRGRYRRYLCGAKAVRHVGLEKRTCWALGVRADAIEADVWDSLVGVFRDRMRIEELLRQAQREELESLAPKRGEMDTVTTLLAECEQQSADIACAIVKATGVVGHALEQEAHTVNLRYEALSGRRDELAAALTQAQITIEAIQDTVHFAEEMRSGRENPDFATMRRLLESLRVTVTVKAGRFYVESLVENWEGAIRKLPRRGKGGP